MMSMASRGKLCWGMRTTWTAYCTPSCWKKSLGTGKACKFPLPGIQAAMVEKTPLLVWSMIQQRTLQLTYPASNWAKSWWMTWLKACCHWQDLRSLPGWKGLKSWKAYAQAWRQLDWRLRISWFQQVFYANHSLSINTEWWVLMERSTLPMMRLETFNSRFLMPLTWGPCLWSAPYQTRDPITQQP